MATQRPSFPRADTDAISMTSMNQSSGSKGQPEYLGEDYKNPKGPSYVAEDEVPQYETEVGEVRPVEDAKDLVTKVIHVDDDMSINPWYVRSHRVSKC